MIDDVGLASAARWFVDGIAQRSGIQVSLDAPRDMARLPAEVEIVLFRVLQEGLTNVHRHSGASAAEVLIRQETGQVILEVKDNGRGIRPEVLSRFDRPAPGMGVGLSGMRERVRELGGRMKLEAGSQGHLAANRPYLWRLNAFLLRTPRRPGRPRPGGRAKLA